MNNFIIIPMPSLISGHFVLRGHKFWRCFMFIYGNKIEFEKSDAHFIKKFGIEDAGNIVLEYNKTHNTPFVFDTYQLSKLLYTTNKKFFLLQKIWAVVIKK